MLTGRTYRESGLVGDREDRERKLSQDRQEAMDPEPRWRAESRPRAGGQHLPFSPGPWLGNAWAAWKLTERKR